MYKIQRDVREFEFYYLVELTRQKIKPLSRWEKPLTERSHQWLRHHGLFVKKIPRKTLSGNDIIETIFSTSQYYTDFYQKKFSETFINNRTESQELEGFLFGYPACCVKEFIRHPYAPNNIDQDRQSLLFHWACNGCRLTPGLIPYYQAIHKTVSDWYQQELSVRKPVRNHTGSLYKIVAGLLLSSSFLSAQTITDSTHYIPLADDMNENALTYDEEIYLGTYDHGFQSGNCESYAKLFKTLIDSLPDSIQTDSVYRIDHKLRGIVQCSKCDTSINMGYVTIVNPLRNLQLDIPCLGLHFMEKGFFSYGDDKNCQRVDIDTLKKIIYPFDLEHLLSVEEDSDGDGLKDTEEDSLWLDYTQDNPDFNGDGVPDGAEVAEELIRLFPKLKEQPDGIHSSIEFKPMNGLENCQICGSIHNMGYIEISNPENQRTCQIPYLSLHAMAHGSFTGNGTVHENYRPDVVELYRTMKTHMLIINNDADNDGLKDEEERSFGKDPNQPDSNDDGVCDGKGLAQTMVEIIKSLPTEPNPTGPYVEYLGMDGIQMCSVCGDEVVMGVYRIFNPLINTPSPYEISSYAFHFLQKGSFSCEGPENNRINPVLLSAFLNYPTGNHVNPSSIIPEKYDLKQNYPNPFNPRTIISYELPTTMIVDLSIYDLLGKKVATLVSEKKSAGYYQVGWDASGFANGVYYYRLEAGEFRQVKKMVLLQ